MPLLPKDLQRFSIDGPHAAPQYIKATGAVIQLAEQLIDCFTYSIDDTYGMLQDSLEPLCLSSQRHRLIKGMIHILEDRLTFQEELSLDPLALREKLFTQAAQIGADDFLKMSWRDQIIAQTASELGIEAAELEDALYCDLKRERKITAFESIKPEALIAEYNLTLAKSLLLYAKKLTFTVDVGTDRAAVRKLFQSLRFFNLLFEAQPVTETVWQFSVDGPTAVLPQPQKYASSMAAFLPNLYAFQAWHATSDLEIDGHKYQWQLKPNDFTPPVMHFPHRLPEEAQTLMARITEAGKGWQISQAYPFLQFGGQGIWIPDFSVCHTDGRVAHVEVLGFWRTDYLNRRLKLLQKAPQNLILVISDKLKLSDGQLEKTGIQIVMFKRTPRFQDVLAAAEKCACPEKTDISQS
ncbi:MAG: DUF790 family protein [Proteobacteria bacterium]|nr:DUF790 family protein [Pseudomonadota bacterium]